MTHPTDDELEAMAARLEASAYVRSPAHEIEAAAMLRACKVRGNRPEQYCAKCGAPKSNHPYRHPFVSFSSALDPAPDHDQWNAAIEVAAEVADHYDQHVSMGAGKVIRKFKKRAGR